MDSQLAIHTIKESCYRVGYPTHDAEYERRKLINQSCDYAIECIEKIEKIEQIIKDYGLSETDLTNEDLSDFERDILREVLEQED
jgi:hypothetical protein